MPRRGGRARSVRRVPGAEPAGAHGRRVPGPSATPAERGGQGRDQQHGYHRGQRHRAAQVHLLEGGRGGRRRGESLHLVHRTDCDGVTHIEVSRGNGASMVSVDDVSGSDVDVCGRQASSVSARRTRATSSASETGRASARRSRASSGPTVDAEVEPPRPRQRQDEPKLWTTAG